MNFAKRSDMKELLDGDQIPFEDILLNMQELNTINTLLGGHTITIAGFKALAGNKKQIHICEIGCGGGDNLVAIYQYAKKKKIALTITGIDIKRECIAVAQKRDELKEASLLVSDYRDVHFLKKPDIIFSSLFCHHFTNDDLVKQIWWMQESASIGFFINDLQRHWLAFYAIKLLTQIFSSSYLVKNDAPLSVARGFIKKEWEAIFHQASLKKYSIHWKWAFRYLVLVKKEPYAST
ncbi:MAG: methyltransferase domain-containing protein [Chitinophagaceae bacterium]|jgi:2-polyprenyl-3-methyl-5-hydroxy-6-metoxy-1,4-benzoquinol methylase|nr:methyltransferase domain-containing protein [Chitinophagaceae bacterium]